MDEIIFKPYEEILKIAKDLGFEEDEQEVKQDDSEES